MSNESRELLLKLLDTNESDRATLLSLLGLVDEAAPASPGNDLNSTLILPHISPPELVAFHDALLRALYRQDIAQGVLLDYKKQLEGT